MDLASVFASSVKCYYIAIEVKLGNPQGEDETTAENCGHCPNCLGKKVFPAVDKNDSLRHIHQWSKSNNRS